MKMIIDFLFVTFVIEERIIITESRFTEWTLNDKKRRKKSINNKEVKSIFNFSSANGVNTSWDGNDIDEFKVIVFHWN